MVGEAAPAAGLATVSPARSPQSARRDGSRATEVLIVPETLRASGGPGCRTHRPPGERDLALMGLHVISNVRKIDFTINGFRSPAERAWLEGGRPTGRPPSLIAEARAGPL